jgi:hypothetical protein
MPQALEKRMRAGRVGANHLAGLKGTHLPLFALTHAAVRCNLMSKVVSSAHLRELAISR